SFKNKKNPDLWIKFLELYRKHNVEIKWIKGHANNIENERCDELAVKAYKNGPLSIDEGYENTL
ncbi:MAG: ribonuclease HI, partial [Bacteroidales bacterium]|nr:ribonuclease HI [Bacteroidales bacterium]